MCGLEKSLGDFYKRFEGILNRRSNCKVCELDRNRKYCTEHIGKVRKRLAKYRKANRKKINEHQKIRNRKTKETLVKENGGKCQICGYNRCIAALDFHHNNPDTKENQIKDLSLELARKEIKKCILVCSNCHKEIHNPDYIK